MEWGWRIGDLVQLVISPPAEERYDALIANAGGATGLLRNAIPY
jgi:hypothetical protein